MTARNSTDAPLIFNSFADAVRKGFAPITAFSEIQAVTRFINDCYDSAGWTFKKAPWSATETLFSDVIQRVRQHRCLPADLPSRPDWA